MKEKKKKRILGSMLILRKGNCYKNWKGTCNIVNFSPKRFPREELSLDPILFTFQMEKLKPKKM